MSASTSEKIQIGMGSIMTAVGVVGVVAPDRLDASSGTNGVGDESRYQVRLWTLRESALGLILLGSRKSPHRRGMLGVVAGLAAAEVAASLQTPALTGQGKWSAASSAAVFGAASLLALLID